MTSELICITFFACFLWFSSVVAGSKQNLEQKDHDPLARAFFKHAWGESGESIRDRFENFISSSDSETEQEQSREIAAEQSRSSEFDDVLLLELNPENLKELHELVLKTKRLCKPVSAVSM